MFSKKPQEFVPAAFYVYITCSILKMCKCLKQLQGITKRDNVGTVSDALVFYCFENFRECSTYLRYRSELLVKRSAKHNKYVVLFLNQGGNNGE